MRAFNTCIPFEKSSACTTLKVAIVWQPPTLMLRLCTRTRVCAWKVDSRVGIMVSLLTLKQGGARSLE